MNWKELFEDRLADAGHLVGAIDEAGDHVTPVEAPVGEVVRVVREAWQGLGDKLAVEMPGIEDEPRIEALAKALYCEHGVRVVGGDEAGDHVTLVEAPVGEVVRVVREALLLSDAAVDRVARGIHASHDRGEDFDDEPQAVQDEYLDMAKAALVVQDEYLDMARAALAATMEGRVR